MSWKTIPDADPKMVEYGLTSSGQFRIPLKAADLDATGTAFKPQPLEKALAAVNDYFKRCPEADTIMVWHESAPSYGIPEDLLGLPIPEANERQKLNGPFITPSASDRDTTFPAKEFISATAPAQSARTLPLRHGANPDYYDYLGIEIPSQVVMPSVLSRWACRGCASRRISPPAWPGARWR